MIDNLQMKRLDSWRGTAAMLVVSAHALEIFAPARAPIASALAGMSVTAFFIISGFLISRSLDRHSTAGRLDLRAFAAARTKRILPPLVLSFVVCVLLWAVAPVVFETGVRDFVQATARKSFSLDGLAITTLLLNGLLGETLSVNPALWSLAFEVWLYALAAMATIAAAGRRWGLLWLPAAVAICVMQPWFLPCAFCWLAGFAIERVWRSGLVLSPPLWLTWLAGVVPLGALISLLLAPRDLVAEITFVAKFGVAPWLICQLLLVLDGRARSPMIGYTGSGFSYSLYVLHYPILLFCFGMVGRPWMMLPGIVFALAAAMLAAPIERLEWRRDRRRPSFQPARADLGR